MRNTFPINQISLFCWSGRVCLKQSCRSISFWFLISFSSIYTEGVAQGRFLETIISVKFTDRPLADALQTIADKAGCRLSYNPNSVDEGRRVNLNVTETRLRDILRQLLGDNYQFKERNEFVVIRKLKTGEQIIGGYIGDNSTGKKLDKATVYDKKSLKSATTDRYGYYEIVSREPIKELTVSRYDYSDTAFQIRSMTATNTNIDLSILPKPDTLIRLPEPQPRVLPQPRPRSEGDRGYSERTILENLDIKGFMQKYSDGFRRPDADNVRTELRRRWHWSLFPYAGNNGGLSGSVVNDFSFNATVGYSRGNRVFEVGGLGNINRGQVSGLQVASLFNVVKTELKGLQVSGIVNRAGSVRGGQVTAVTNNADILRGGQMAGINNFADIGYGGYQMAGIVNKIRDGKVGVQISGIANEAEIADVQIGLINNANHLRGFQIGLININDTLSGVVLGLINFVRRGYTLLEVSGHENRLVNLAYKSGTSAFYTTYIGSVHIDSTVIANPIWGIGMGFGSSIPLSKNRRLNLTLDLTAQHFSTKSFTSGFRNELLRFAPALSYQLSKKIGIAVAPTYNAYYHDPSVMGEGQSAVFLKSLIPAVNVKQSGNWRTWFGVYIALRLF
jgi:hypothetical protein